MKNIVRYLAAGPRVLALALRGLHRPGNPTGAVVACLGLSPRLEGEEMRVEVEGFTGGDRTDRGRDAGALGLSIRRGPRVRLGLGDERRDRQ